MFDLSAIFGGEHHTNQITTIAIKKKAAKALQDTAPTHPISKDIASYDTNGDGHITASDCMYDPGSVQAKLWHQNVLIPALKFTKNLPEAIPYQEAHGHHFLGMYNGHPVIEGTNSQGNIEYITDKLVLTHGMSKAAAQNISSYISETIRYSR